MAILERITKTDATDIICDFFDCKDCKCPLHNEVNCGQKLSEQKIVDILRNLTGRDFFVEEDTRNET